ncbi:MAG: hypothetical protein EOO14_18885, partial [Chitinophagaceae bacterium]
MKLRTLFCCLFIAFITNAQTKEAEFKKLEALLNKSKGLETEDFNVLGHLFTENTIRLDLETKGTAGSFAYANLHWDNFLYQVKETVENKEISQLILVFAEKIDRVVYEKKKKVDQDKSDEIVLMFNTADARLIEQQLKEIRSFTIKSLYQLRTADKEMLTRLISTNLNAAMQGTNGKIKNIAACEITFALPTKEITVPTKNLQFHSKSDFGFEFKVCFGIGKTETVMVKIGSSLSKL